MFTLNVRFASPFQQYPGLDTFKILLEIGLQRTKDSLSVGEEMAAKFPKIRKHPHLTERIKEERENVAYIERTLALIEKAKTDLPARRELGRLARSEARLAEQLLEGLQIATPVGDKTRKKLAQIEIEFWQLIARTFEALGDGKAT